MSNVVDLNEALRESMARWKRVVELIGLAGIEAKAVHLGGGITGVQIDYSSTRFYALVTDSEMGPGYTLGFYHDRVDSPIELSDGLRLSQVITRLKGLTA